MKRQIAKLFGSFAAFLAGARIAEADLTNAPIAEAKTPVKIEQRVLFDDAVRELHSETRINTKEYRALIDARGADYKAGADITIPLFNEFGGVNLHANIGLSEAAEKNGLRTWLDVGNKSTRLAGSYQTLENKTPEISDDDYSFASIHQNVGKSSGDLVFDSKRNLTTIARTQIGANDSVGLGGTISTDRESDFQRYGPAWAHTGKVGFFAYAMLGKEADGKEFKGDIRLRGGVGGKVNSKSITVWADEPNSFYDFSIVTDITDPLSTGNLGNYAALVRGDPFGFDIRYLNGTYSAQIAQRIGSEDRNVVLMPRWAYNEATKNQSFTAEARLKLGRGISLITQTRMSDDKKPEHLGAVVLTKSFFRRR